MTALAALALEQNYVRPVIDDSDAFEIRGGRHPVVQQALARAQSGAFIDNDCVLGRAGAVAAARVRRTAGRPHLAGHRAEHGR